MVTSPSLVQHPDFNQGAILVILGVLLVIGLMVMFAVQFVLVIPFAKY
jgi:hypothetical protein